MRRTTLVSIAIAGGLLAWAAAQFTHERFDAVALLVAAFSVYYLGARFYSAFIADRVLRPRRCEGDPGPPAARRPRLRCRSGAGPSSACISPGSPGPGR